MVLQNCLVAGGGGKHLVNRSVLCEHKDSQLKNRVFPTQEPPLISTVLSPTQIKRCTQEISSD